MTGARGEELNINISNAGEGSFPTAWPNYHACASYDRKYWFRVPSSYDKESGVLLLEAHAGACEQHIAACWHMPQLDCTYTPSTHAPRGLHSQPLHMQQLAPCIPSFLAHHDNISSSMALTARVSGSVDTCHR